MKSVRGSKNRRAPHHDGARMVRAVALAQIRRRAVEDTHPVERHFERVRRDLREHGLQTLSDRRRSDIHGDRTVGFENETRVLLGTPSAALDEASDGATMIAPADEPTLNL